MSTELKPCPFCGCHGIKFSTDTVHFHRHTIKCEDCPGRMEFFSSTREQAVDAWNRRAAGGARDGFVLVPKEPTEAMLNVMHDKIRIECIPDRREANIKNDREVWSAILAAAPATNADAGSQPDLDELRRVICAVGIVGQVDGQDVIRRSSVIDLIDRRRAAAAGAAGQEGGVK